MNIIKAKKITKDNFSKYGSFCDLYKPETMGLGAGSPSAFYPDAITFNFGAGKNTSVCVCHVEKRDMVITTVEYHDNTCEGILSLDADIVIFAGFGFKPYVQNELEAFIVPAGTVVKINPGVLHGTQFPAYADKATVLVMLPERTFATDVKLDMLEGADQIRIELE